MKKIYFLLLLTLFAGSVVAQSREVINPVVGAGSYVSALTLTKVELLEEQGL